MTPSDFEGKSLNELTSSYNEMVLTATDLGLEKAFKVIKKFKDIKTGVARCKELDSEIKKKTGKVAKPAKANGGGKRSKREEIDGSLKISLLVEGNPKKGTAAPRFAYYKDGMTVSAYRAKVGDVKKANEDLHWDANVKGYIKLAP